MHNMFKFDSARSKIENIKLQMIFFLFAQDKKKKNFSHLRMMIQQQMIR